MILTKTLRDSPERRKALEAYVSVNSTEIFSEEVTKVAICLEHILDWYETGRPLGHFLTSILKNDFKQSCFLADEVNRKVLLVYAFFLYWELPQDYLEKAKTL